MSNSALTDTILLEGKTLGARITSGYIANTDYLASTDGFVMVDLYRVGSGNVSMGVYSDTVSPVVINATNKRQQSGDGDAVGANDYLTVTVPIKAGEYWRVYTPTSYTFVTDIQWIPMVSAEIIVPAGQTLQVQNAQSGVVQTGTTVLPDDDTIPQITEGDEYITLQITPTSATSKLRIEAQLNVSGSVGGPIAMALFKDAGVNAYAVSRRQSSSNQDHPNTMSLQYYIIAGSTSAQTFRIRAGLDRAGTTTINGVSGARRYGGAFVSSITITEIAV